MEELERNFVVVGLGILWNFMMGGIKKLVQNAICTLWWFWDFFFQNGEIRNFFVVGLGILWWWD